MANHEIDPSQELHHEPLPVKVYVGVFAALMFLTFMTVWVAQFHFGDFNMVVAMAVAAAKASLVVLYFMNLKHDHDRLNGVIFLMGLFFLAVFIGPTMWDTFTRSAVDPDRGRTIPEFVKQPGQPSPMENPPGAPAQ